MVRRGTCGPYKSGSTKEVYRDELVRLFVDVPDASESRKFFEEFKERVKDRFRQLDIWMTTYPIEVL